MNTAELQAETVLTPEEAEELMREYKRTNDINIRNQLVMHYTYIARVVATQMYGLSSNYAQLEDIVNEGIIAIINCVEKFNPERGASFKSFAFRRVQGAVIDFVRKQDWFPRRVRMNAKNIVEAHDKLCNELMREPTEQEIADHLGMTLEQYQKNSYEASNSLLFSFEGVMENMTYTGTQINALTYDSSLPENQLAQKEMLETLTAAIESLSEREQLVITLYYFEHLKLSSIAKIMGVSDQRVSQISSRAVMKIRKIMVDYMRGK
ncbi:MAG: FliA/WhiG family RNA polymerase sigma factor [Oscillospiraceae bacterium]|nr:FliA/WhiG family RNA polymerase sigma factor [Oscillospiraceae bacterium]